MKPRFPLSIKKALTDGQLIRAGHPALRFGIALAIYLLIFFIFPPHRRSAATTLSILPIIAASISYGLKGGLIVSLLSLPLNTILLNLSHITGWDAIFRADGGVGSVMLVLIGLIVGHMRDLHQRLNTELRERKRIEAALNESEWRLEKFFSQASDGFFFMRLDEPMRWDDQADKEALLDYVFDHHRITQANDSMISQYHTIRDQFIGLTPANLFSRDLDLGRKLFRALFDEGHLHYENELSRLDGSPMWIEGDYICMYDDQRRIIGQFGMQRDVTERKAIEMAILETAEAAEFAVQAKTEFLANMSHEIRTPLNSVIGMADLLGETPLNPEQKDFVEIIRTGGEALLAVVNNILDFSKIEAGKLILEVHPFELRECLSSTLDLVAPPAFKKGLELAYAIDPSVPDILSSDFIRVRQVLMNLLNNAVKFTESGEVSIMISAEPIEQTRPTSVHDSNEENNAEQRYLVHFAITDTGPGISPERQAALFEAFTQADTTVSRRYGGTGLGLSISKRLTELLGGTIWVESAGLGHGSTFHFTMNAAGWSDPKWDILKKPAARLVGKKVLLIHQHLTGWSQIYTQAKTWGMIPIDLLIDTTTPTLPEPLTDFDMIMLDQQLLERLKPWLQRLHEATQSTFSPPLVLVTPVGGCDEAVRASLEAVCLTKPIKFKELYQVFTTVGGRLPLQAAAEQASPAKEGLLTGQIHPLRILLAEDNKVNQKVALRLLKQLGYQADVAINGLEVLQLIDQKRYDVILMDIQMPEMDGLEATRQIKTRLVSRDWPRIIALTANALTDDRQKYLNAGMDDYLSKPFRAAELEALLLACPSLADKPQIP